MHSHIIYKSAILAIIIECKVEMQTTAKGQRADAFAVHCGFVIHLIFGSISI